ncbi:MAG: 3-dehydroquinate synthase [Phycisphaerae bacterium]
MMSELRFEFGGHPIRVRIAPGLLETIGRQLSTDASSGRFFIVSDETVGPLYAERAASELRRAGLEAEVHLVPPLDESKSLGQASELYDRLAAGGYTRDCAILAIGGGMVSDLAGFVAATWMRGMGFFICPTTLESAIDACLGGKTAINHPAGKNLIGAFHQPQEVLIDPQCLTTLPERDLAAGLAESVKHGAIHDTDFLAWQRDCRDAILNRDPAVLVELIERNLRIKAGYVGADERDATGPRAMLNFGHTVGHALEAWAQYRLRHGECVALGMAVACRLSVDMGLLEAAEESTVVDLLAGFNLPVTLQPVPPFDTILDYIRRDKKNQGGRLRFVLLDGLGQAVLRDDVPDDALRRAYGVLGA